MDKKEYIIQELSHMIKDPKYKIIISVEDGDIYTYTYDSDTSYFFYNLGSERTLITHFKLLEDLIDAESFIFIDYEEIRRQQEKLSEIL